MPVRNGRRWLALPLQRLAQRDRQDLGRPGQLPLLYEQYRCLPMQRARVLLIDVSFTMDLSGAWPKRPVDEAAAAQRAQATQALIKPTADQVADQQRPSSSSSSSAPSVWSPRRPPRQPVHRPDTPAAEIQASILAASKHEHTVAVSLPRAASSATTVAADPRVMSIPC